MQDNLANVIFALLRFELFEEQIDEALLHTVTPEIAVKAYKIGFLHDVGHLIADALDKLALLPKDDIKNKMLNERRKAVFRFEQLDYETHEIVHVLEEEKIPYVLLKGAVIRKNYPQPWMRTSCDVDILVKKDDFERATNAVVEKLDYKAMPQGGHDISLYSAGGTHLELHYALFDDFRYGKALNVLDRIWEYTYRLDENTYAYALLDEAFYFYHIAHMAKHFEEGGCGIRSFIDLYYLDHVWEYQTEKRDTLLEEGDLLKFANGMRALTRTWFCKQPYTELTKMIETYILEGGVYGTMDNRVVLQQTKSGSRIKYFFSRIWLPYDLLKHESKTLQKHKWLLPFYQVRRWFRMLFQGRMRMRMKEMDKATNVSQEQTRQAQQMLEELGLE